MSSSIRRKVQINHNRFPTILVLTFYFLYFIKMLSSNSPTIILVSNILMMLIGILSTCIILFLKNFKGKTIMIVFFLVFLISAIFSALYTDNYRINDFLLIFQYFGIGLLICKYQLDFSLVRLNFYMYTLFFSYNILIGKSPDLVFGIVSRNMISILMLIQVILYYISQQVAGKELSLLPSFITLIISIWGVGRGGIISSLILFGVILLISNRTKGLKIILVYIALMIFLIVTFDYFYSTIYQFAFERSSVMGFVDQSRESILNTYLSEVIHSIGNLFFGVTLNNNFVFSIFGYNLHNSYLRLHAYHGMGGVLLILFQIVWTFISFLKKRDIIHIGLLFTVLLRISTDVAAFHGPFDPILVYLVYFGIVFTSDNNLKDSLQTEY